MADWLRVQGTSTQTGSGVSQTLAFGAAVTSGNIVVGALLLQNGSNASLPIGVTSITDDQGNPYRIIATGFDEQAGAGAGLSVVLFRSLHLLTNAPQTLTFNLTTSANVFWRTIEEFSPPTGTTDISLSGQQYMVADSGATIPNFQTLDNDVLVWGISMSTGTSSTGAGFNAGQGTGTNLCTEWKIQATPTNTMSVLWATQTALTWAGAMAIAPVAPTRWEPIQRVTNRNNTGLTCAVSFPNAVGAGNMVVGSIACDDTGLTHLTSLQDDKGNNYLPLIPNTLNSGQGTGDRQTWWSNGLLSNGPKTVTATYNASQAINFLIMDEFAPPPNTASVAIDGTPTNTFNNTAQTSVTTPNVTTSKSGDLAYGWADTAGALDKPGNSFCVTGGESRTWMTAYYITGAPGSYNFVCNCGSGAVDASLAIFGSTQSPSMGASFGVQGLASCEW